MPAGGRGQRQRDVSRGGAHLVAAHVEHRGVAVKYLHGPIPVVHVEIEDGYTLEAVPALDVPARRKEGRRASASESAIHSFYSTPLHSYYMTHLTSPLPRIHALGKDGHGAQDPKAHRPSGEHVVAGGADESKPETPAAGAGPAAGAAIDSGGCASAVQAIAGGRR
jgi:hypothetical protein